MGLIFFGSQDGSCMAETLTIGSAATIANRRIEIAAIFAFIPNHHEGGVGRDS